MHTLKTRWLSLVCFMIVIAGLAAGLMLLHLERPAKAHAASTTPTITTSKKIVHAFQTISVKAQGFAPNETVSVYFFYDPHIPANGFLTCDNNGNCSGTATAADLILAGSYQFTGVGNTSGLQAVTPVTVIAGLQLTPNTGGPNTAISLNGSCFTPNETVKIYWGGVHGTLLGTASTDSISGNWFFSFNAPTGLQTGNYAITVVRTNQKPGVLSAHFHYIA